MNAPRAVCIGIDTSCYTTSVAAVDQNGALAAQRRKILPVKKGQCGLRQSDALYQHVLQLPDLFRQLLSDLRQTGDFCVQCVCVSTTPRSVEDSYMPVFRAGAAFASTIAASFDVPLYETSHQTGHLLAATLGSGFTPQHDFLAVHLSGGTCEMLRVNHQDFQAELIGATDDISAGQMMDRVGVRLGLPFPAGVHMERLAGACPQTDAEVLNSVPVSVRGMRVSFSGPASALLRQAERGENATLTALRAYSVTARTLAKWLANGCERTGLRDALLMGGVASSEILRSMLLERIQKQETKISVRFSDAALASDNAVGVAVCGARLFQEGRSRQ